MKETADKEIREELEKISKKIDSIVDKIRQLDEAEADGSQAEVEAVDESDNPAPHQKNNDDPMEEPT